MGLEVSGVYDRYTGKLFLTNLDSGQTVTVNAESGGKPLGDPIPPGRYEILEQAEKRGRSYRLDAKDRFPRNDIHDEAGRYWLRLHEPGNTVGCIAACRMGDWSKVESMIRNTSTTKVLAYDLPLRLFWTAYLPYWVRPHGAAKENVRFGELEVIDSRPKKDK